jgi:flagellar hook-basal body complex protein FliE
VSAAAILGAAQVQATAAAASDLAPGVSARVLDGQRVATSDFARMVSRGIGEVNQQLLGSQVDLQRLAAGDVQNLHQIMIRLEESRLSFQLLLQVRNRLLEAYQDVLKMQV